MPPETQPPNPSGEQPVIFMPQEPSPAAVAGAYLRSSIRPFWENPVYLWAFQGFVAMALGGLAAFLILWSDNHNDQRYVPKADYDRDWSRFNDQYKGDREATRSIMTQDKQEITRRLDRQEQQLDDISKDIKELIRGTK